MSQYGSEWSAQLWQIARLQSLTLLEQTDGTWRCTIVFRYRGEDTTVTATGTRDEAATHAVKQAIDLS